MEATRAARRAWLLAAVLGVGALIRLVEYFAHPALSVDEAMLALNVATRSYAGLLHPLDYGQTAPPLFLWGERLVTRLGGVNEGALRALPLVAGVALPGAVWLLARRLVAAPAALLAAAFTACSPILIVYSRSAKQYEWDALVATLLTWLAVVAAAQPSPRAWRSLVVAGAAAILASTPAIFVLGGVIAAFALAGPRRPVSPARVAGAAALWGGLFAVTYVALYRPVATLPFMRQFWEPAFLAGPPRELPARLWGALHDGVFATIDGHKPPAASTVLLCVLFVLGLVSLRRRHGGWVVALCVAPLAAAALASTVHRYPVSGRLVLFLTPATVVVTAAALADLAGRLTAPRGGAVFGTVSALWLAVLLNVALRHPHFAADPRPLVRAFRHDRAPGEPVYLFAAGLPAWVFYATDWTRPDTAGLAWFARVASPGGPAFGNALRESHAVRDEGAGLERDFQGEPTVVGTPTGMQLRNATLIRPEPDSGWAQNEAARIRAAAHPGIWVFLEAYFGAAARDGLATALAGAGGARRDERASGEALLWRYEFR